MPSNAAPPSWLAELVGRESLREGTSFDTSRGRFRVERGIVRAEALLSAAQDQTSEAFGFKWSKRDTFESERAESQVRAWLRERYGAVDEVGFWCEFGPDPVLLDAGCGAGRAAIQLFGSVLPGLRYLGADVSAAVEVAADRFSEEGLEGAFIQADLQALPLRQQSVDVIFSEGVLHHTDSTEAALKSLVPLLKPGGRILFYVYRKKGPIREFTDDYVRDRLSELSPEQAWDALMPLTKLGQALGELDVEVDVPDDIEVLGIPAGRLPLQRLWYWHVFKAFYDPELGLDELNHINYDWYAPLNAHRQTPDEVRQWCAESGLTIERERVEEAGITIVARREP